VLSLSSSPITIASSDIDSNEVPSHRICYCDAEISERDSIISDQRLEIAMLKENTAEISERDSTISDQRLEIAMLKENINTLIAAHATEIEKCKGIANNQRLTITNLNKKMANMISYERHEEEMNDYVLSIIREHNANLRTYQLDDGKNEYVEKEQLLTAQHIKEMNGRNNIISHQRTEISRLKCDYFSLADNRIAEMTHRDRMISDLKKEIATLRSEINHLQSNKPSASAKPPKTPFRQFKSNSSKLMRQTKETLWTKPIAQFNGRPLNDPSNEWEHYAY